MRALAITGLKVFGVMQFYWATAIVPQLFLFAMMFFGSPVQSVKVSFSYAALLLSWLALALFSAWAFTFRTPWIVDRLGVPAETQEAPVPPKVLLRIGLVLIGISAIISGISYAAQIGYSAFITSPSQTYTYLWPEWSRMTGALAKLLLAFILIRNSAGISSRVFPSNERINES